MQAGSIRTQNERSFAIDLFCILKWHIKNEWQIIIHKPLKCFTLKKRLVIIISCILIPYNFGMIIDVEHIIH